MAAHSHDEHYTETKPVAFTVPFILAAVVIFAMGLFLSLCDPTHAQHNAAGGHGKHGAAGTNDGHHKATDKDMQTHGEAKGPDAAQTPQSAPAEAHH